MTTDPPADPTIPEIVERLAAGGERAPRLADVPPPSAANLPRWFAPAIGLCAVMFVPWIVYLAVQLPDRSRTAHYALTWVGYDLMMWSVLVALAFALFRRSTLVEPLAIFGAAFMIIDVWFDVTSADSQHRLIGALLSAALVELPGAAVCIWIAANAALIRKRAYRRLFRWAVRRAADDPDLARELLNRPPGSTAAR